jgi:predicted ATPase
LPFVESIRFPSARQIEMLFRASPKGPYLNLYPANLFHEWNGKAPWHVGKINLLCGGNGAGKSTALKVLSQVFSCPIEEESDAETESRVRRLAAETSPVLSGRSNACKLIRSEDIALHLHRVRQGNRAAEVRREELRAQYLSAVRKRENGLPLYAEEWALYSRYCDRHGHHTGRMARELAAGSDAYSNGETSMRYLSGLFKPDGLYLLDEPENSLSPMFQQELAHIIEACARFENCQFFIATHSPFFLAMQGAMIFQLDSALPFKPIGSIAQLPGMQAYFSLIESLRDQFEMQEF